MSAPKCKDDDVLKFHRSEYDFHSTSVLDCTRAQIRATHRATGRHVMFTRDRCFSAVDFACEAATRTRLCAHPSTRPYALRAFRRAVDERGDAYAVQDDDPKWATADEIGQSLLNNVGPNADHKGGILDSKLSLIVRNLVVALALVHRQGVCIGSISSDTVLVDHSRPFPFTIAFTDFHRAVCDGDVAPEVMAERLADDLRDVGAVCADLVLAAVTGRRMPDVSPDDAFTRALSAPPPVGERVQSILQNSGYARDLRPFFGPVAARTARRLELIASVTSTETAIARATTARLFAARSGARVSMDTVVARAGDPVVSVQQPWASLLVRQLKTIENRTVRPRRCPGWFAVHASRSRPKAKDHALLESLAPGVVKRLDELPAGRLLGWAHVSACHRLTELPAPNPWALPRDHANPAGTWCWVIDDAVELHPTQTIAMNGMQTIGYALTDDQRRELIARAIPPSPT